MFVSRLILFVGLCAVFAGCSTGGYYGNFAKDSTTEKGVRYLLGRGVPRNSEKAFYYFKKAAEEENNVFAQNELAYLYAAGKGTQKDYKKALMWYQKAANKRLASAEYNLGLFYLHGLGATRDEAAGLAWIKKAKEDGFDPNLKAGA